MSSPHVISFSSELEGRVSTPTSAVVREGCVEKESGSRWEFRSEASQESLQKKMGEGIRNNAYLAKSTHESESMVAK